MALKTEYWRCNLYGVDVVLAWNGTPRQLEVWVEQNLDKGKYPSLDVSGITLARTWCNDNGVVIYMVPPHRIGDLHHECIHVATGILNTRGVGISTYEDEHLAYYSTFWFKEFYKKMKRDIKG